MAEPPFLTLCPPPKTCSVIDHEERSRFLDALDGSQYKVSAGGSLSNSLVALVGGADHDSLHCSFSFIIHTDKHPHSE